MMDIKEYLESGIIENYCLGTASAEEVELLNELRALYPEIEERIKKSEAALDAYVDPLRKEPSNFSLGIIKKNIADDQILENVTLDKKTGQLSQFFNISKHTNIDKLEKLIQEISAPDDFDNFHLHPIYETPEELLAVVWLKEMLPAETHSYMNESFFVLQGEIDCIIEQETFELKRGSFMRMPLNKEHTIVVTSKTPAKAILFRSPSSEE